MGALLSVIPTERAVEAAWDRYTAMTGQVLDNPRIMLDREFNQRLAIVEAEWKEAYLSWVKFA